jgi:hypothetical protein
MSLGKINLIKFLEFLSPNKSNNRYCKKFIVRKYELNARISHFDWLINMHTLIDSRIWQIDKHKIYDHKNIILLISALIIVWFNFLSKNYIFAENLLMKFKELLLT